MIERLLFKDKLGIKISNKSQEHKRITTKLVCVSLELHGVNDDVSFYLEMD